MSEPPGDRGPDARCALRVLLIGRGHEPTFGAWRAQLEREDVPFDLHVAGGAERLTDDRLADATGARYNAVVVAVDGPTDGPSVLAGAERDALERFERRFRVRRLTAYCEPSAAVGLRSVDRAERMTGTIATVTPHGAAPFAYLVGEVPLDGAASGYRTRPVDEAFATFVQGPDGEALLGVRSHPDGREELVSTVDANAGMLHFQLLRHGMLSWVTRDVYLGGARDHLAVHIDDVFFVNARWDPAARANRDESVMPIRMTADDALELEAWQARTGFPVELLFNGADVEDAPDDPLNVALLSRRTAFRWTNHTFDHLIVDGVTAGAVERSIVDNVRFAERAGLAIDPVELVTGAHSGLDDPALAEALRTTGVRWIGSDASYETEQARVGDAWTVPRYPTALYANVGTRAELLDEDAHLHGSPGAGVDPGPPVDAAQAESVAWQAFVAREATAIFGHVVGNDPRPHFFHQSNVAEERLLYPVIDEVLDRYRRFFRTPLEVPRMAEAGALLRRRSLWADAVRGGLVRAWRTRDTLTVEADVALDAPLPFGLGWVATPAGGRVTVAVPPDVGS